MNVRVGRERRGGVYRNLNEGGVNWWKVYGDGRDKIAVAIRTDRRA